MNYCGIKQCNSKKPSKWGFKNFVRARKSGIMYDFFIYSSSTNGLNCTGSFAVLKLIESLPSNLNYVSFFNIDFLLCCCS